MQVHLIRHTTLDISTDICYGQTEVPLTQSFVKEKKWLLKQLDAQYDAVFTNPLSRCTQLAQQIPTQFYQTDARLLEMNFGRWELQKWNEIAPESLNLWMNDFVNRQVESGESLRLMSQRVIAFIEKLSEQAYQNKAPKKGLREISSLVVDINNCESHEISSNFWYELKFLSKSK
jgi:alpha-ribazole phosphatase